MLRIIFVMLVGVLLSSCIPEDPPTIKEKTPNVFVKKIQDMGFVEGCSVKYVITTFHPDFYMIRCDDRLISTMYNTGGKSPTVAPVLAVE